MLPEIPGMEATVEAITAISKNAPELFFLAGVERVFTIFFHIAISVLLCYFILKGKTLQGFLLSIVIHFSVDFIVTLMSTNGISVWLIEGVVLVVAVIIIIIIRGMKSRYPVGEIARDPAEIALEEGY